MLAFKMPQIMEPAQADSATTLGLDWRRLFKLWPGKFAGAAIGFTLFFAVYFHVLRHPVFAVTVMPLTPIDHWIVFNPWWMLPYVSLWVYVTLPPFLLIKGHELALYGAGAAALSAVGLAFFFFWPTIVPAMDLGNGWSGPMKILKTVDASGNACPSLHVAFACFTAYWFETMMKRAEASFSMRCLNIIWAFLIVVSTIGTKQHVVWDAVGGTALGLAAAVMHRAAWRRIAPPGPS